MNFHASHNLIVPKYMIKVKQKGNKNPKARAREGGASVFTAMLSFFSVPPSVRRKVLGTKPKQAGKKGGVGGNSAFPFLNQNEASPATLQFIARHHRKILFSLREEKIGRAQNEKSKEYFSVVWRACRAVAENGGFEPPKAFDLATFPRWCTKPLCEFSKYFSKHFILNYFNIF